MIEMIIVDCYMISFEYLIFVFFFVFFKRDYYVKS